MGRFTGRLCAALLSILALQLVEYHDGWSSSFGSEGVGLPRVKQGGGCP